ncbi:MAG: 30S ribosomal protein S6 [Leptospira sp.]|nr:30S ribosomal protein S6 [Leptospira sp.]
MKSYEITAVIRETPHSLIDETKTAIKDILGRHSVEVSAEEDWGSKKLWHKIEGEETGFFNHLKCTAAPDTIKKIEHEFLLNQNILRSLVVRI